MSCHVAASGITWRWYPGDETQTADPFIAAKMGAANTSAYRGTAYVVFEELPLAYYGNRLPQLSFELSRPLADPGTAEGLTQAVTMIPASGEVTSAVLRRIGVRVSRSPEGASISRAFKLILSRRFPRLDAALQVAYPRLSGTVLAVAWVRITYPRRLFGG